MLPFEYLTKVIVKSKFKKNPQKSIHLQKFFFFKILKFFKKTYIFSAYHHYVKIKLKLLINSLPARAILGKNLEESLYSNPVNWFIILVFS